MIENCPDLRPPRQVLSVKEMCKPISKRSSCKLLRKQAKRVKTLYNAHSANIKTFSTLAFIINTNQVKFLSNRKIIALVCSLAVKKYCSGPL